MIELPLLDSGVKSAVKWSKYGSIMRSQPTVGVIVDDPVEGLPFSIIDCEKIE